MLNIELINLYSNMSTLANHSTMSPITPFITLPVTLPALVVSILFALTAFNKYKNLVLGTLSLEIGSHIIMDSAFTI